MSIMTEVMTEMEHILENVHLIEKREYSSFRARYTGYDNSRGSYRRQDTIEIEVKAESRRIEIGPDYPLEDLQLHYSFPVEIRIDVSHANSLVILSENVLFKQRRNA